MKILYIDTTSNYLYSALLLNDKITGEIREDLGKDLSVFTLDKIKQMLESNNLTPSDIDKILVVNGPGSFTGIRIGVTIAKTLAHSLNKPVTTISSLEAMAISSNQESAFKIPIIDARRGFVYAAIYDSEYNPVLKDKYMSLEALKVAINNLPDTYRIITNNKIDLDMIESYEPNFLKIINKNINKETVNPHSVNPVYLKSTEAEEKQEVEVL